MLLINNNPLPNYIQTENISLAENYTGNIYRKYMLMFNITQITLVPAYFFPISCKCDEKGSILEPKELDVIRLD